MAPIPADQVADVVLIDTQAMHYSALYLKFAEDNGLWPMQDDPATAARRLVDTADVEHYRDGLRNGLDTIVYLQQEFHDDASIFWCPMSRLEWIQNRLRARGFVRAANETVAGRWLSRVREGEILDLLLDEDYSQAAADVGDAPDKLRNIGLSVVSLSHDTRQRQEAKISVWDLAEAVLSVVYMSYQDAIVYASALFELAAEIITYDGHFRDVVQALHDPQAHPEKETRFSLMQASIQQILLEGEILTDEDDLTLPDASRPPRVRPGAQR